MIYKDADTTEEKEPEQCFALACNGSPKLRALLKTLRSQV